MTLRSVPKGAGGKYWRLVDRKHRKEEQGRCMEVEKVLRVTGSAEKKGRRDECMELSHRRVATTMTGMFMRERWQK